MEFIKAEVNLSSPKTSFMKIAKAAIYWSFFEKFSYQIINFVVILILSRLLNPDDFGIISILMAIIYILNVFMDGGFGIYIIQKKKIYEKDLSTIFFTNLLIASISYILLFIFANDISLFFDIQNLNDYIKVIGLTLILNALGLVQFVLIERNFQFKKLFLINISSLFCSSCIAIFFAIYDYGVWSLIWFYFFNCFLKLIMYYYKAVWYPKPIFDVEALKESWSFSKNILFSSLVDALHSKGVNFIIGKISTITELGFYEQASKAKELPTNSISTSLRRVFLPFFSKINENKELVRNKFIEGIKLIVFLAVPLSFLMFYFSDSIIIILFSEKWLASGFYLKILSLTVVPYILYYLNIDLFKSKGDSKGYMRVNVYTKLLGLLLICISSFWGLNYILYSLVLVYWLSFFYSAYLTQFSINYSVFQQSKELVPPFIKCVLIFILLNLIWDANIYSYYIYEIIKAVIFIVLYLILSFRSIKQIINLKNA